jgi:membrane-bound lytic murein transglycosylase D
VSVGSIMAANHMKTSRIVAGKTLVINHKPRNTPPSNVMASAKKSVPAANAAPARQSSVKTDDANVIQYKVVSGDTLGHIAEKYNTSVKDIKKLNGLKNSKIVEGKVLLIQVK